MKSVFLIAKHKIYKILNSFHRITSNPKNQQLKLYWDKKFAEILDKWGESSVWREIQLLLINCKGKVLDVACGTGRTMEILSKYKAIDIYGFDISEFLIEKAEKRGIEKKKLKICDATKTDYPNNFFDYSYSIGSLEHFTKKGISGFLSECGRYTRIGSFHMIPVSRSGKNEGWLKTKQSFFNNSESWWLKYFSQNFRKVYVVDSKWEDGISIGKWFLCYK